MHVQFDLAQQTASGDLIALNVRLQQKAPRPETLRLLGCVVTLKDGFGFVRCEWPHVSHTHMHLWAISKSLLAAGWPRVAFLFAAKQLSGRAHWDQMLA